MGFLFPFLGPPQVDSFLLSLQKAIRKTEIGDRFLGVREILTWPSHRSNLAPKYSTHLDAVLWHFCQRILDLQTTANKAEFISKIFDLCCLQERPAWRIVNTNKCMGENPPITRQMLIILTGYNIIITIIRISVMVNNKYSQKNARHPLPYQRYLVWLSLI